MFSPLIRLTFSTIIIFLLAMPIRCQIGIGPLQFFFGNGEDLNKKIPIDFRPDEGEKLRERFERKYGFRGEKLIASFGGSSELPEETNDFDYTSSDQLPELNQRLF